MPKFNQESFSKLSTCEHDLQVLFFEVVRTVDCTILEGYRNQEEQDIAFRTGKSELQWPNGKHNRQPSYAVDVAPCPIDWNDLKRFYWFGGFVLGIAARLREEGKMTHAIRWGGDWDNDMHFNDHTFNDLVHFELIL